MEDHKKMLSTQILIDVKVEMVKLHFEASTRKLAWWTSST